MRFVRPLTIALLALAGATAAQAAHDAPRVDARQAKQQARITAGLADGSLTRAEARLLRAQQHHIQQVERHARADGVVTPQERRHLHRLQDRASRLIHSERNDSQVRRRSVG